MQWFINGTRNVYNSFLQTDEMVEIVNMASRHRDVYAVKEKVDATQHIYVTFV